MSQGLGKPGGSDAKKRAKQIAREWPAHFPSDCPAREPHAPCDGVVFRFHKGNEEDAQSHQELGLSPDKPPCQRAGLSCNVTIAGLKSFYATNPYLKKRKIARATLSADHGCIAPTGARGHHTLWLTRTALASYFDLFQVIE